MKLLRIVVPLLLLVGLWLWQESTSLPVQVPGARDTRDASAPARRADAPASRPDRMPLEVQATLTLIARGGPYPHRQDGGVFQNRERRLPPQPRGYYREYTVATPGSPDRGARRIITGGDPPVAYWYTDDHYRSFRAFQVTR